MCTSPILIQNKKYRALRVMTTSSRVLVPCGTCDECIAKKVKDLYVRARLEHEKCLKNGASAFMCCLTYDNTQLPWYHDQDTGKSYKVFNKKHLIDYFKRLRITLDRHFRLHYGIDAPDFKYLVTSEYGSDPTRTRRPHYHLLIFFDAPIGLFTFRRCFRRAMFIHDSAVFGRVYQCDILDSKRGGVRYSGKYVLKDITYKPATDAIRRQMEFEMDRINLHHGIILKPATEEENFHNTCVRRSGAYQKDVHEKVLPYRHMLQFYMCSNDFGVSAALEKYGESIVNMPTFNLDGFVYAIPKIIRDGFERKYGTYSKENLVKVSFMNFLRNVCKDAAVIQRFGRSYLSDLIFFADTFIQPRFGGLYLVSDANRLFETMSCGLDENWHYEYMDELLTSHGFYCDNDLYEKRAELLRVLSFYNSDERLRHRAYLAKERKEKQRKDYERKKRNKPCAI